MQSSDLLFFLILLAVIFYWLASIRAKEIAVVHAKQRCNSLLLNFLDDTVALQRLRLRRSQQGSLRIYREYRFEFTSTGEHRYRGMISLLGSKLINIELEPYRLESEKDLLN